MTMLKANTRDLGIAIRDLLQGQSFYCFREGADGELHESDDALYIEFVDVSDADNPVVHLDNGQTFVVRIVSQRG